jgi:hypothetical protein
MIVNMINVEFSDRRLSPHKFMPVLGVHTALNLTRGASAPLAGELSVMPLNSYLSTMNKLFGVLVGIFVCSSVVADENDFRCLKSIGLKSPIRLQFVFRTDKHDLGYVIYQNGSGPIPVKRLNERELRAAPGGRPSEFETHWQETGGTYVVVSQGALINDFRYIRRKDGKIINFEEDLDAFTEKGCEWNIK